MRRIVMAWALGIPLLAQSIQLSTTAEGDVLYLTTAVPRRGTKEPPQGRVYTIKGGELSLLAERAREVVPATPGGVQVTNHFWFTAAEVEAAGRTLALTAERECLSGRNCVYVPLVETEVGGDVRMTVAGRVQFSPNGRWMLRFRERSRGTAQGGLVDLTTGLEKPLLIYPTQLHNGTPVANDGSVVLYPGGELALFPPDAGEPTRFIPLTSEGADTPAISADAQFVVYASRWHYPHHAYSRLRIARFSPLNITTLIEGFGDYWQPVLSHDGGRVAFLSNDPMDNSGRLATPQAHVMEVGGGELKRLTEDPSGITTAILSGNGRIVYALSRSGRLLRVDVDSGARTELLPPFIQIFSMTALVAGSRVDLEALDDPSLKLFLGEKQVDLRRSGEGRFSFVLPFDFAGRTMRLRAESAMPAGPFEPQVLDREVTILSRQPRAYDLPAEYGGPGVYGMRFSRAYDEGFNRLITPFEPAAAGSIVHVLATGLGPVNASTGELSQPLTCRWNQPAAVVPIPPLFAGLLAAEPGVYELRFRLPDEIPPKISSQRALQIACAFPGSPVSDLVLLLPM